MSVIIDQLRVSDEGKHMYLNAHIANIDSCKNVHIKDVTIRTYNQVYTETNELKSSDENIYQKSFIPSNTALDELSGNSEEPVKSIALDISINDVILDRPDFSHDLFFVYITTDGTPDSCIPCRMDEPTTIAVTFDDNLLYQKAMGYTKQLHNSCGNSCAAPSKDFIDFILLWNAFKASIETEHYVAAKQFYDELFGDVSTKNITRKCGCHG